MKEGVRTLPVPVKHRGIGISNNTPGPPHTIISIQAGSALARNGNIFVGESIAHTDTAPTSTMNHTEPHRAWLGLEYTSISLGISDSKGFAQTLSVLRSSLKTPQAPALKTLRDRRQAHKKATNNLTKDGETEIVFLSVGEPSFIKL